MYRVLRHLSSLFIVLSMVTSQESDDYCIEYIQQSSATNAKSCSCDAIEKSCFCTLDDHDAILDPCTAAAVLEDITLGKGRNSSLASRQVVPDTGNKLDLTSFHPLLGVISDQLEPISHIGRLPSTPTEIRTKFMAYRTSGRGQYDLKYSDSSEIMKLKTDISKMAAGVKLQKVYIVVHGFHEKIEGSYEYDTLKTRLAQQNPLIRDKPNSLIVMVDWSHGAKPKKGQGVIYTQAAINAVVVGRELAVICKQLVTNGLVNPVDFHLIGFGLGAQVIHFAARWFSTIHVNENVDSLLNLQEAVREDGFPSRPRIIGQSVIKLGRLTGLDPTARHFQGFIDQQGVIPYINRYDAVFVDIVHTSSVKMNGKFKDMIRGRFGMSTPVGHVDFYVNGGRKQPGCGKLAVTCNHKKALNYFISSLTTDPETKDYLLGVARENYVTHYTNIFNPSDVRGLVPSAVAVLGIEAESTIGWGVFYMFLITTSNFEVKDIRELIPAKYDGLLYETNELENGGVPDPGSVFKRYPIHNLTEIETRSMDFTTDTAACGQFRQSGNNTGRVQNGHQPYAGQFPWVVCILKYQDEFSGYGTMCTGTILTDEFIVTAGHCFWRREDGVIMPKGAGLLDLPFIWNK
ncbi:Pancreatic lipase-related protein 2 [Halotydeus destructor]|nr:Pancreatic lipase-related protein 2 [Halotydeus destructor]